MQVHLFSNGLNFSFSATEKIEKLEGKRKKNFFGSLKVSERRRRDVFSAEEPVLSGRLYLGFHLCGHILAQTAHSQLFEETVEL